MEIVPRSTNSVLVYDVSKRVMDVSLCVAALPVVLPLAAVICLLIMLDSKGSPLFIQRRVGKDGCLFNIYKFRTMHNCMSSPDQTAYMCAYINGQMTSGAPEDVIFKPDHKNRITYVGRFLRSTSLDELPQIINVLKGEMSIVGPRPNMEVEVSAYSKRHIERLKVLPGITGLAQINGRSGLPFDQIVKYDLAYIERRSIGLDIQIMLRTVLVIIRGKGAG